MRAPPVSSYCHCSRVLPATVVVPSPPRSGCCRSDRAVGSVSRLPNERRVGPGNWLVICSPPLGGRVAVKAQCPTTRGRLRRDSAAASAGHGSRQPTGRGTIPTRSRMVAPHRGRESRYGVHEGCVLPLVEQHQEQLPGSQDRSPRRSLRRTQLRTTHDRSPGGDVRPRQDRGIREPSEHRGVVADHSGQQAREHVDALDQLPTSLGDPR